MLALNVHPTCRIYSHHLSSIDEWENPPFEDRIYVALLAQDDTGWDEELVKSITETLLVTGCLSISVWARSANRAWDAIQEIILTDAWSHLPLVMTYDLSGWSAEDVAIHLLMNLDFDDHVFVDFIILYIGDSGSCEEKLADAIRSELLEGE